MHKTGSAMMPVRPMLVSYCWMLGIALGLEVPSTRASAASSKAGAAAAVIIAVEGHVQVLPKGATNWVSAKTGQALEVGYQLRTGAKSRALLRLSNLSVLRVGELMQYEIQPPRTVGSKPVLDLKAGSAYFFSRDKPEEIELRTPVVSGAIRGTEFNVTVASSGRTTLTLIDGEVELVNAQGAVVLTSGQEAVAEAGRPPTKTAVLNAVNVIQWSLYYPAILDPAELNLSEEERQTLGDSLDSYRNGDLPQALQKYPAGYQPTSAAAHVYLGGLLLAVGLVEQSETELAAAAAATNQGARLADAIRQLVAAVKFQNWERRNPPELATEWLAESYYRQSRAQLTEALAAARHAVEKSPTYGFGWERVAELEFSFGRTADALEALDKGLKLAPRNAQAVALNGFLLSAQNRIDAAIELFDQAIALDGALGNAWLGRGLCRIRRGQAEAGREDLQVAAALEPDRALLRSYLGKAFSEVGDSARAEHELRLGRELDPNDPTSWLYSALLHQQENRINQAIRDLEQSQTLNDNRRVYRSRLLVDQDAAVRGANLAAIYRDAGMKDVSVRAATRAVNSDYANYSAHLFLANSYNQLRDPEQINLRYETPWLSEYLLANLLAPVGAGTLSQTVSEQDYSKLFERDGVGVASSTEYFSRGDWVQSGAQYGHIGNFGYALDSLYRSENGQRPNNDQEQLTLSLQFKQQLTAQDAAYLQTIYYNASGGDLAQYYDPNSARIGLRTRETQEPLLLLGYHHEWSPGVHTLVVAGRFDDTLKVTDPDQPVLLLARDNSGQVIAVPTPRLPTAPLSYQSTLAIYSAEAQQIWQQARHALVLGARYQFGSFDTQAALGPSTPTLLASMTTTTAVSFATAPIAQQSSPDFERVAGYGYYHWRVLDPLQLTAGLSCDYLRFPVNYRNSPIASGSDSEEQASPKAGFTWTPAPDTTVRFAYTRSLGGVSFDQSIRLEPAQVAGFNQAFRSLIPESVAGSTSGAKFETFGLALGQRFKTGTYLGVEAALRNSDVNRVIGAVDLNFPATYSPSVTRQELDYQEKNLTVTINQLLGEGWSLGARYELSKAELETNYPDIPVSVTGASRARNDATLHQLALFGLYNHNSGFFARTEALWNRQVNHGYQPALPGDDFWQFDVFAGYRLFQRRAQVQIGMLNLTDRDYRLNPLNLYAELPRQRTFTAGFQFSFKALRSPRDVA